MLGEREENLARRERALPPEARARYFDKWQAVVRDEDTYFVLAWVLGGLGAHRFYLGQTAKGLLHLCLFPAGVVLCFAGVGAEQAGLFFPGVVLIALDLVYWGHDLVKYREVVAERNTDLRCELLERFERS